MPCNYPQDAYGCVAFRDWEKSLDEGCKYSCFTFRSYEPEKEILEKKMSLPRLQPPQTVKDDLPIPEAISTPLVVQPQQSTPEVPKPSISDSNPLLGAFLIAAASSVGIPILKDWIKGKIKKGDDDQPIECKPAQVKTNKKLKDLSRRIDAIENKSGIAFSADELEDIKNRLSKLESQ